jgi:hypothetical protein
MLCVKGIKNGTLSKCEGCYFNSDGEADKYGTKSYYSGGHHGQKTKFKTKYDYLKYK